MSRNNTPKIDVMKTSERLVCGVFSLILIGALVAIGFLINNMGNLVQLDRHNLEENLFDLLEVRCCYIIMVVMGTYMAWLSGKAMLTGKTP